jgi:hypothetical protein
MGQRDYREQAGARPGLGTVLSAMALSLPLVGLIDEDAAAFCAPREGRIQNRKSW